MQMLTKLLVTRIVASRCSTLSNAEIIALSREAVLSRMRLSSLGVSEKNATSEPETSAEMHSSRIVPAAIKATSHEKPKYVIPKSSKSIAYWLDLEEAVLGVGLSLSLIVVEHLLVASRVVRNEYHTTTDEGCARRDVGVA